MHSNFAVLQQPSKESIKINKNFMLLKQKYLQRLLNSSKVFALFKMCIFQRNVLFTWLFSLVRIQELFLANFVLKKIWKTFFSHLDRCSPQHDPAIRSRGPGEYRSGWPRPELDWRDSFWQPDPSVHQISSGIHGQFCGNHPSHKL